MSLSFDPPEITGEQTLVPPEDVLGAALMEGTPPPAHSPSATATVRWHGQEIGVVKRTDWLQVDGDRERVSFRTYLFTSCSGNTRISASSIEALCDALLSRLSPSG